MNLVRILLLLGLALPGVAWSQAAYPDRPVRLVVPFPPGGGADNLARAGVPRVAQLLGQQIVIENRPGAGGNVGAELVARATPDGYTLLYGTNGTHGINHALYAKVGFDPVKDFAPITRYSTIPAILTVHPAVPAQNVRELLAYLKANPGKVAFSSSGNGTTSHMAGELFRSATGVDILHVPYKGGGPSLMGLIAGDVQMNIDLMANVFPQVRAGKLRALGVTTLRRLPIAPEVPTLDESGIPGYEIAATDGIYAPAGTPRPIIERLNAAFRQALSDPEVVERLQSRGAVPAPGTPEELARHVADELPKWARLVKQSGAKLD